MRTEIDTTELVVWAPQKSLAEAKSLFAPYAPKFQTVPCNEMTALAKATVSVLYLSNPEQDTTVENALVALRHCRVSGCWSTRRVILRISHSEWEQWSDVGSSMRRSGLSIGHT